MASLAQPAPTCDGLIEPWRTVVLNLVYRAAHPSPVAESRFGVSNHAMTCAIFQRSGSLTASHLECAPQLSPPRGMPSPRMNHPLVFCVV